MNLPLGPLFSVWKLEMKSVSFLLFFCSITVLLSLFSSFSNEDHDWLSLGETFASRKSHFSLSYGRREGGKGEILWAVS